MEVIKMIASVAGEEVFMGECHPARARVLVKKQLASWKDGKLLLHILGIHDKMLESNPHAARGPLDDANVSQQELERRLAWFRQFVPKVTLLHAQPSTHNFPSLEEAAAWAEGYAMSVQERDRFQPLEQGHAWEGPPFHVRGKQRTLISHPYGGNAKLSDTEAETYFTDGGVRSSAEILKELWSDGEVVVRSTDDLVAALNGEEVVARDPEPFLDEVAEFLDGPGLEALWETDPVTHRVFGMPLPTGKQFTEHEYEEARERDRVALLQESQKADYLENPPEVVATMDQVRCLWSRIRRGK